MNFMLAVLLAAIDFTPIIKPISVYKNILIFCE